MQLGIFRLIGNDLWPRDTSHSNFDVAKTIIEVEPNFDDCHKIWILNRLIDKNLKSEIHTYVTLKNQKIIDIPFERNKFIKLGERNKLIYLLSINVARNIALEVGRKKYDYTMIFDGDCFFEIQQWNNFIDKLNTAKNSKNNTNILSFPVKRIYYNRDGSIKFINDHLEEPQLGFCSSSKILFDETLLYGNRNKIALLENLKFERVSKYSNYYYPTSKYCLEIGEVYHLAVSNYFLEKFGDLRRIARWMAIFILKIKIKFGVL